MENLILAILIYIAIVAIAYQPKPAAASPVEPVATVEETTETETQPAITKPQPKTITEPLPAAAFKTAAKTAVKPLEKMTIRELYAAASAAKIKRYKRLNKAELIQRLTA